MIAALRRSLGVQVLVAVSLLLALLLAAFVLLVLAIEGQRDAAADARRSEQAVTSAAELQRLLIDLETGQRGFLVTGEEQFLEPYRNALRVYPEASENLVGAASTPEARGEAEAIAAGMRSYVDDFLRDLVALGRRDLDAAREVVAREEGRRRVDALRRRFSAFESIEHGFADQSRDEAGATADRAIAIAAAGLGGAALLLVGFAVYLRRSVIAPVDRLAATADRVAAGDLGARVHGVRSSHELGRMARSFNDMATSLERASDAAAEADRVKDEFFTLVSHELRTPLTSIVGYAELLGEDAQRDAELSAEERGRFIEVINRNGRRLLRLVGDLLFVARLEAGQLHLDLAAFDLAQVVRDSVEAALPRAEAASVRLVPEIEELPPVCGDQGRIGQAIDNLVSNAVKFTPEGGKVTVRCRLDGGQAAIEVADTGIGIPAADQERLFERFFRASSAESAKTPGAGLGLVITKAIAEGHGGDLDFDSVEGSGTTFWLRLPLGSPTP